MTRRQIHRSGLTALAATIITLSIAIAMLGHATMAGGPQWSAGALFGCIVLLGIVGIVGIGVGFETAMDALERRQAGYVGRQAYAKHWAITNGAETYEGAQSLAEQLLGRHNDGVPPHWAERTAHEIVYELDDADLDEIVAQRSRRRRHAAGHR